MCVCVCDVMTTNRNPNRSHTHTHILFLCLSYVCVYIYIWSIHIYVKLTKPQSSQLVWYPVSSALILCFKGRGIWLTNALISGFKQFPKQPWPLVSTLTRLIHIQLVKQNEIRENHKTIVLLAMCCRGCFSEIWVSLGLLGRLSPWGGRPLMLWEETKYSCFRLVEKMSYP